jgi:hypothetical protein
MQLSDAPAVHAGCVRALATSTKPVVPPRSAAAHPDTSEFASHDHNFEEDRVPPGSNHKEFTYFLLSGARFIYASTARLLLIQVPHKTALTSSTVSSSAYWALGHGYYSKLMPVYIAASTDKSWPLLLLLLLLYVLQWMASMTPSADVLALANAEVDVGAVAPGQGMTIKWRGKPIFIRRRTEDEIAEMKV